MSEPAGPPSGLGTFRQVCALAAVLLVLVLVPTAAPAQRRAWPLTEGDRVRLYSPSGDSITAEGVFERLEGERIVLTRSGLGSYSVTVSAGDLLAVRHLIPASQRSRHRALWGAFAGGSLGGIVAPFAAGSGGSPPPVGARVAFGVVAGGLIGAGVGAVAGYLLRDHRWERFRIQLGN